MQLPPEPKHIIEERAAMKRRMHLTGKMKSGYEQIKDLLSQGLSGHNQHALTGDLKGWYAFRTSSTITKPMNWNYRVVRRKDEFGFYEVFYGEDGEVLGHTEAPVAIRAESEDELRSTLQLLFDALAKPIVEYRE